MNSPADPDYTLDLVHNLATKLFPQFLITTQLYVSVTQYTIRLLNKDQCPSAHNSLLEIKEDSLQKAINSTVKKLKLIQTKQSLNITAQQVSPIDITSIGKPA